MSNWWEGSYPGRPQGTAVQPGAPDTTPSGDQNTQMQLAIAALQNAVTALNGILQQFQDGVTEWTDSVTALNAINTTLTKVLPLGTAVVSSSSGASGKFLAYTAPNGTQYVIPLDLP